MAAVLGRYARAFAEVAVDHKLDADKTVAELSEVAALIEGNRQLRNVLENPAVAREQKLALLNAVRHQMGFGKEPIGEASNPKSPAKLLRNFLAVLVDHNLAQAADTPVIDEQELNRRMGI